MRCLHASWLRRAVLLWLLSFLTAPGTLLAGTMPPSSQELAWALHYDPKTLDPAKVDDEVSELVRFLTGGVLIRINRVTMAAEPALAESWLLSNDGKAITFHLRPGSRFSDGSPLRAIDVVATLQRVLSAATGAPVAEEFLQPGKVHVEAEGETTVVVRLPVQITNLLSIFDEIAIEPAGASRNASITAGPYVVAEYRRGEYLRLRRNEFFWQRDARGTTLPYLPSLRLDILANRDTEELRFLRGDYALLNNIPAETFSALQRRLPGSVRDLGPSLNTEQMWFNQSPKAPIASFEKQWFSNAKFRTAISAALHRKDMVRIAFDGHATPANGFVSPANTFWYNRALPPALDDPGAAQRLLTSEGFTKHGAQLFDRDGHPVKFSLLTNAGNRARERMAALIQQDLSTLGIEVNVVTLDFPALIERLMHSGDYEAALLGLSDIQPDPSGLMNVWLSSSPNHQWNPSESTPATAWEAEIDRAMRLQAESSDPVVRKKAVDRVQAIVADQKPFIYLVYPDTLCAISPRLEGERLSVLQPAVVSSIQTIRWKGSAH